MKHQKRIFTENVIIFFIALGIIFYILKFLLSFFDDTKIELPKVDANLSIIKIDTDALIRSYIKKDKEQNITIQNPIKKVLLENKKMHTNKTIKQNNNSNNNSIINLSENIKAPINKKIIINNEKNISKAKLNKKTTIIKNTIIKNEKTKIIKNEKTKKKQMLVLLRQYIKNTIISVRSNTNKLKNIAKDKLWVKIRITVLKNGTYQNLSYLKGNKDLLGEAKIAVNKTFPRILNKTVQNQFPRYLRFKIEFTNE